MRNVCVLLCTYNGGRFLALQLDSLKKQKNVDIIMAVHDDGSSDDTLKTLSEYGIKADAENHLGAAHGFFHLMEHAPEAEFYAFCDQDDIWDEDKLSSAVEKIEKYKDKPALYCCSTRLVDVDGKFICDHIINSSRSLTSRLFYSSISGNTIVFNKALLDAARMHHPENMIMHDSWMVKLCIAIGGELIVDETPHMDYRMHGNNTVGMELNFAQKFGKFKTVIESSGEGQELIDICSYYKDMVLPEYADLANETEKSRTDKSLRKEFMKRWNIDFKSKGFNTAFAMKVSRGNL